MAGLFDLGIIQHLFGAQDSALPWLMGQAPSTGLPPNVQQYMQTAPSFGEGQIIPKGANFTGPPQAERDAQIKEMDAWQGQERPSDQLEQALNRARNRGSDYPNVTGDIGTPREVPRGTYWPISDTQSATQSSPPADFVTLMQLLSAWIKQNPTSQSGAT